MDVYSAVVSSNSRPGINALLGSEGIFAPYGGRYISSCGQVNKSQVFFHMHCHSFIFSYTLCWSGSWWMQGPGYEAGIHPACDTSQSHTHSHTPPHLVTI